MRFILILIPVFALLGCNLHEDPPEPALRLMINELMPSGSPDWIELYNPGNHAVNLGGYILDDGGSPSALPDTLVVPALGFLRIPCSLLSFNLSNYGETVTLTNSAGVEQDQVSFPPLYEGLTWGRRPDGGAELVILPSATPGQSNRTGTDYPEILESLPESTPIAGQPLVVLTSVSDHDSDVSRVTLAWGTEAGNYPDSTNMSFDGDHWRGVIPEMPPTVVHFRITATDAWGNSSTSSDHAFYIANYPPAVSNLTVNPLLVFDTATIRVTVSDPGDTIASVVLNFTDDQGTVHRPMTLDDGEYTATLTDLRSGINTISVTATDDGGCEGESWPISFTSGTRQIAINELMADNGSTIADAAGDFDDWIELYNPNGYPVDVGGLSLSDNPVNPGLWRIPTTDPDLTTIPSHGFLLIWADDEATEGVLHAGFRLAASGETLTLSQNGTILDSVSYPTQTTDVSYGRDTDGIGDWIIMTEPTPGTGN